MSRLNSLLLFALSSLGTFYCAGISLAATMTSEPSTGQETWPCVAVPQAAERMHKTVTGLQAEVAFKGEKNPQFTIEARMEKYRTPGFSVAVIHDGKLDWSAAWGVQHVNGRAVACDSLFQAGSIAKPVTVLAALRMRERGLVDLDQDIKHYLKSYTLPMGKQSAEHPVNLRNLLSHTSGITPGGYRGYAKGEPLPSDLQTVLAEPPSNSRKVEVLSEPGRELNYSGGGYTVAEIALQDKLDAPFEEIMRTWVTTPVGMRQADFTQPPPVSQHALIARGHTADGKEVVGGWHNHPEQAAAGLWATASDLAAFLIEIRKGYLGQSEIFKQVSIQELLANPFAGHAYGFRLKGEGDQLFITHYGGTAGYNAGMTLNLRSGQGAAYLSNSEGGAGLGNEFFNAVSRAYAWTQFKEQQVTRRKSEPEHLQALVGTYAFEAQGWKVSVAFEKAALALVFPNGDRYAMTPIQGSGQEFIHADTGVRARFTAQTGDVAILLYGQTGKRVP